MIKSRIAVAAALCAVAGAANAGFTLTPAVTTDYDFRGVSQSNNSEEAQLALDWTTESGVYFGVWGSAVDFGKTSTGKKNDTIWEADAKAGYAWGDAAKFLGYDVGIIGYFYPSARDTHDVYEIYAGVTHGWFSGKFSFGPDFNSARSYYAETAAAIPLPNDFTFGAHLGYSFGNTWAVWSPKGVRTTYEHLDYSIGMSKKVAKFDVNLKYVNSNDYKVNPAGRNAWIGTVSTTLPWK
jgi:uncharacterized protein (TIGR02001 family)